MKITASAKSVWEALQTKTAKVTSDIAAAEKRVAELIPQAEASEEKKKALIAIRSGLDRAKKIQASFGLMARTLQGMDYEASVELNDNECALLGYVDTPEIG